VEPLSSLAAAAELLPADKYGYQPTPPQMTFGDLIARIVQTNVALCSRWRSFTMRIITPPPRRICG
jgi:hypothetical protein